MDLKRSLSKGAHDKLAVALRPLMGNRDVSVLRDVTLTTGWVGHVVVCPGGVYVIEPRRWRGKVEMRRGRITRSGIGTETAIRETLDAATRIRRRLASSGIVLPVGAIIALTDASTPQGPIDMRALDVVEAQQLPDWLLGKRRRLRPIEIDEIRFSLTPHHEGPILHP